MTTVRIDTQIVHQPARTANRLQPRDWVIVDGFVLEVRSAEFIADKKIAILFDKYDETDGQISMVMKVDREAVFGLVTIKSRRTELE